MSLPDKATPHDPLIRSSWTRCTGYGLAPDNPLGAEPVDRVLLAERLEANARLVTFAQPIIEHLHGQLDHASSMVLLADREGLVLRAVGDGSFVSRAQRVALMPGAHWAEAQMGTNAIGTAVHEMQTVSVIGEQHFLERNRFLTCIATPIHAPSGGMLGILDLSSDVRVSLPHARALLHSTAEMIEHRLLESMSNGHLSLHFSPYQEMLGSPLEAIAVFDEAGRMLACNRNARQMLGLRSIEGMPGFEDCFDAEWRRLLATPVEGQALELRTRQGRWLMAQVRLRVAPRKRVRSLSATQPAHGGDGFDELEHGDARMRVAVERARKIADRNIPLLIQGETGSGKEWFARAFHLSGPRRDAPWVAVNCASIPATLIEAELFGYAPGAFTGARARGARGKILEAHGGTLFLDEIGDMPLALQAVLLRVLETRAVVPLGASEEVPVDIGLVCASHRPLQQMVADGQFRADLLFRLNGLTVWLPPLRERADFDTLVARVVDDESPGRAVRIAPETLDLLRRQAWPGNLRQMRNVLRVAIAMLSPDEHELRPSHLPEDGIDQNASHVPQPLPAGGDLRATERRLVRECLDRHDGNVSAAARELGITRTTLYRKLRQTDAPA
ncbi:MAG: sigma-54-dependent Fis family transcriptional regulator [Rhodocyclaceae bacterium]|nr:sigma-54-dependent Fis family transcriptional regulator [Rhodocyclaceae bacterium]